jgi:hypothetical protein
MQRKVLTILSASFLAACVNESDQVLPVSTTSEGMTTRAPAAAEAARRDQSFVRFVHTIPDVVAVDVYADDMRLFTSVPYGMVTPFKEVPDEGYTIRIRPAGQDMAVPMAEEKEGLGEGRHYTIAAFRKEKEGKAEIAVFNDRLTPPDPGTAKLRVINASPDVGEIDVFTPGADDSVLSDVDYMESTDYAEIKPMSGKLLLHREDEKTVLLEAPPSSFDAGKVYTLILLGWSRGAPPDLKTIVVEDRFGIP